MTLDSAKLYSRKEVAKLLNCSVATLRLWHRNGIGPKAVRVGRRLVRYDPRAIQEFLEGNKAGGAKG